MIADDEIERLAFAMCRELGLDPHEQCLSAPDQIGWQSGPVVDVAHYVPRWRQFQNSAALAIAAHRAIATDTGEK